VYVTGRSANNSTITEEALGGTLEDLAESITALGGTCIPVRCDHNNDDEVKAVFDRIEKDHGKLDILVNNVFQKPNPPNGERDDNLLFKNFWEQPGWFWDALADVGLRSHYIASVYAVPLLRSAKTANPSKNPLIVHISSYGGITYTFNVAYGVAKAGVDRMAKDMNIELKPLGK
jgi:NAD(P)-dependent dehydrogenase (short-subunit alcohol dehydrogenase family)